MSSEDPVPSASAGPAPAATVEETSAPHGGQPGEDESFSQQFQCAHTHTHTQKDVQEQETKKVYCKEKG